MQVRFLSGAFFLCAKTDAESGNSSIMVTEVKDPDLRSRDHETIYESEGHYVWIGQT